ncbi:MAG: ABC transporter permease [Verrucomicrobiae bacterium]|nr:ABC transporter permease [Verrucomicrobiae bacterium]
MPCAVSEGFPALSQRSRLGRLRVELWESLLMAFDSITSHKLRSGLTLLGILIGVFSIIVVMTALRALEKNAETILSQLGPHTFTIKRTPAFVFESPKDGKRPWEREPITYKQGLEVARKALLPVSIGLEEGFASGTVRSRFEETNPDVGITGITPGVFAARNWNIKEGRALQDSDVDSARLVCVLGNSLAAQLFPHSSPVGERITFDGLAYRVVGLLESKGNMMGGQQDNFLLIPITTGLQRYANSRVSISILVQAAGPELYDDTVDEVRGLLRNLRKNEPGADDDFEVMSNDSLMNQFNEVTFALRAGAAIISSISLVAAGVGIMNIMLISVTERTKEIGVRRAIGARKGMIMTQFIQEAVILCLLGGVTGVALGVAGGNVLSILFKTPVVFPYDWMTYGLVICTFVGVVFGAYPAFKAANIDPIDALRYE